MPQPIDTYRPFGPKARQVEYDATESRRADHRFYASTAWQRLRLAFLANNPLCADCAKQGRVAAADHVHHMKERHESPDSQLEWTNLESLCHSCHSKKHAISRGGSDRGAGKFPQPSGS